MTLTTEPTAPAKPESHRFGGPRLYVSTPGGTMDEPLAEDVCRQLRRLVACVQWLDPQDCTWWVKP